MPPDSTAGHPEDELSELLNIGFPADTDAIGNVADAIDQTLIELQVPEQKRLEIDLAVQEALVNAVVHGCNNDRSKEVRCRLQSDPLGRIVITVTDLGQGSVRILCPTRSIRKTSMPTTDAAFTSFANSWTKRVSVSGKPNQDVEVLISVGRRCFRPLSFGRKRAMKLFRFHHVTPSQAGSGASSMNSRQRCRSTCVGPSSGKAASTSPIFLPHLANLGVGRHESCIELHQQTCIGAALGDWSQRLVNHHRHFFPLHAVRSTSRATN